jgi:ubiquinone/menaquinone biosynthesis C-methylase UbiE
MSTAPPSYADTRLYYRNALRYYEGYAAGTGGWHHGIWDPGVRSHPAALLRSNARLLEGFPITPTTRVLDVGCGVGGFALWAASTYGCRIVAINVCEVQLALARARAVASGLAPLCTFVQMDMNALALAPSTFDLVVNQETLCHALDKAGYLRQVRRVLRPGGQWRAIAFSRAPSPPTPLQERVHRAVQRGFRFPPLFTAPAVQEALRDAGFGDVEVEDLSDRVRPTARLILRTSVAKNLAIAAGLDWRHFGREPIARASRQGHFRAGLLYSWGLLRGYFRHYQYTARKP